MVNQITEFGQQYVPYKKYLNNLTKLEEGGNHLPILPIICQCLVKDLIPVVPPGP